MDYPAVNLNRAEVHRVITMHARPRQHGQTHKRTDGRKDEHHDKQANVIPVPKVQPPGSIESDLRSISLTPTLSKLLESYVGKWIMNRILPKLDSNQFGAIRGRSTTHALVDMLHIWHKALDQSQHARVMFVDFPQAFDRVDHTVAINRPNITELAIPGLVVKWFASFLTSRQQRVKIANHLSPWHFLKGGMPQGSWLGPLTFIIIIDKLKLSCTTHKYIDDTTPVSYTHLTLPTKRIV